MRCPREGIHVNSGDDAGTDAAAQKVAGVRRVIQQVYYWVICFVSHSERRDKKKQGQSPDILHTCKYLRLSLSSLLLIICDVRPTTDEFPPG